MATLYVVGTPVGNLGDLTHRAEDILRSVSLVACEDTRVTKKLLDHYKISTPTTSLHHHSTPAEMEKVMSRLRAGDNVAVVTDAGMPGISDPGGQFVALARTENIPIEVVPGPSAVTAALSLAGVPADQYLFLGFLPHKKGRQTLFQRIAATEETVVLYESPHRLLKTLESLAERQPDRTIVVCRELTKMHESVVRESALNVAHYYQAHPDEVRGEIVIIIGPQ